MQEQCIHSFQVEHSTIFSPPYGFRRHNTLEAFFFRYANWLMSPQLFGRKWSEYCIVHCHVHMLSHISLIKFCFCRFSPLQMVQADDIANRPQSLAPIWYCILTCFKIMYCSGIDSKSATVISRSFVSGKFVLS